jgi:hypothetical protein
VIRLSRGHGDTACLEYEIARRIEEPGGRWESRPKAVGGSCQVAIHGLDPGIPAGMTAAWWLVWVRDHQMTRRRLILGDHLIMFATAQPGQSVWSAERHCVSWSLIPPTSPVDAVSDRAGKGVHRVTNPDQSALLDTRGHGRVDRNSRVRGGLGATLVGLAGRLMDRSEITHFNRSHVGRDGKDGG